MEKTSNFSQWFTITLHYIQHMENINHIVDGFEQMEFVVYGTVLGTAALHKALIYYVQILGCHYQLYKNNKSVLFV